MNRYRDIRRQMKNAEIVIWVDKEGIEVETALSTWQLASIMPKDISAIKAVSPRPDVTNFRCYIEWAR